jgi:maleate isomerase
MSSRSWPVRFDAGPHPRARFGFVLIPNSQLVESEMARLAPPGIGLHFARGSMPRETNVANLTAMGDSLGAAAASLLPGEHLDVVSYACTTGSLVLGEERVHEELARNHPGAQTTSTVGAVLAALDAVGARRIVVATPYLDELNGAEAEYLRTHQLEVLAIEGLNLRFDSEIVRVAPDFICDFACAIDQADADAIFISCAALRAIEVVDEIERRTGKPVITSNQALLWHCLRLGGMTDCIPGCGALLRDH